MTLTAFIAKWLNRYCDFDQKWSSQCMDLMRQFIQYSIKKPAYSIPASTYAKDAFKRFPDAGNRDYLKIKNSPTNSPISGDIIFWNGFVAGITGVAGHVAIVTKADVNQFEVFNQNWPIHAPCTIKRFSYRGVLGWLRAK